MTTRGASMQLFHPRRAVPIALALFASGCSRTAFEPDPLGELIANRALWRSAALTSYTYRVDRQCFCGFFGAAEIEVRDGVIVAVTQVDEGTALDPEFFHFYDTVEDLFDLIEDAIARDAAVLEVRYDGRLGYPRAIVLDFSVDVADDELSVTVSGLVEAS